MTENAIRAAGYVRVSTEEQKRDGWNLDEDRIASAQAGSAPNVGALRNVIAGMFERVELIK